MILFFDLPAIFGGVDGLFRSLRFLVQVPGPEGRREDAAGQICEVASFLVHHWKTYHIRTEENVAAFMASCLRVFPSLDPAVRRELEQRLHVGVLPEGAAVPPEKPPNPYVEDFRTCGSRHGRVAEADLYDTARAVYHRSGLLPLKARRVEASEVGEALARAEVVTFDARGLIPARMFNASMHELSTLHPAHDIEVHATSDGQHGFESVECKLIWGYFREVLATHGPGSLLDWFVRHEWAEHVRAFYCQKHWTLKELSGLRLERAGLNLSHNWVETSAEIDAYIRLIMERRGLFFSNINVRRLPNWTRDDFDPSRVVAQLGLGEPGELVEYMHNYLWLGATPGGLHFDMQDNVLVQIAGESEVICFPANCSLSKELSVVRRPNDVEWLKSMGPDVPFFLVRLRPGDAMVLPSNTVHGVLSQDPQRIGMNLFFEPVHGKMRWPGAPANFYNFASAGHLALRSLWVKAIADMWRTRPIGAPSFAIHGERQEVI